MSLIRKHGAVLQAWACLALVPFPMYTTGRTGSHYSRSTSHSTVLRGSCLLYYCTCDCVCHFCSGLSATVIKEYCIVLYCTPCSKKVVHQAHIDNSLNSQQRVFIIPSLAHCMENLR